jgi:hypothetical protein
LRSMISCAIRRNARSMAVASNTGAAAEDAEEVGGFGFTGFLRDLAGSH